jgi:release factor glutamine methyltransferase
MAVKIQTIKDIRFYLARELGNLFVSSEIRVISDLLIKNVTGITKLHELYDDDYIISSLEAEKIIELAGELKKGKPVQYVLGETIFYNCTIRLNSSTLIPRPETEELVDLIIRENKCFAGKLIDFGTGSGCIAIALALNLPHSSVTGIDISDEALVIANENAAINKAKVKFLKVDIFNPDNANLHGAAIIASNPPYVLESEKSLMAGNVLDFEPHLALFVSDSDPLAYYKAILEIAKDILLPQGLVYFEINEKMGGPMAELLKSYGYSEIKIVPDINNKERIIKARKNV